MRAFYSLLIFILSTSGLGAQMQNHDWSFRIGSAAGEHDEARAVAVDAAGNTYVSGVFEGTIDIDPGPGEKLLAATEFVNAFLVKYDSTGALVWGEEMECRICQGDAVAVDAQGNVYLVGTYYAPADADLQLTQSLLPGVFAQRNLFFNKYDPMGNLIWSQVLPGTTTSDTRVERIHLDASNNLFLTGTFKGQVDFDPGPGAMTLPNSGDYEPYFAKYDSVGSLVWARNLGISSTSFGTGEGLKTDSSGNVYVSGYFSGVMDADPGPNTVNLTSNGSFDIFVAKYNASGDYLWAWGMGGTGFDAASSLALDANSNVVIAGYFDGTVDFDPGIGTAIATSTNTDGFVAKYSSTGAYQWSYKIGGTGLAFLDDVAISAQGNIFLTGSLTGTVDVDPGVGVTNFTQASSSTGLFFAKYDAGLSLTWAQGLSATVHIQDAVLGLGPNGDVHLAGKFNGTTDLDPGPGANPHATVVPASFFAGRYSGSAGTAIWGHSSGEPAGGGNDLVARTVQDSAGNVYALGNFYGTVDFDPGPGTHFGTAVGETDIFVAKYDHTGAFLWVATAGGTGTDGGNDIGLDGNGNPFVVGIFRNTVDFDPGPGVQNLSSAGNFDAFLWKLTPNGAYSLAENIVSGTGRNTLECISLDAAGNIYVGGDFGGQADFDPGPGTTSLSTQNQSAFFARYSNGGAFLGAWKFDSPGSFGESVFGMDIDPAGKLWLTGRWGGYTMDLDPGPGTFNVVGTGSISSFIAKYEPNGTFIQAGALSGPASSLGIVYDVATDTFGSVFVAGAYRGAIDFDPGPASLTLSNATDYEGFIGKYSSAGNLIWALPFAGNGQQIIHAITTTADGSVLMGGTSKGDVDLDPGVGVDLFANNLEVDGFVVELDSAGIYNWGFGFGSVGNDWVFDISPGMPAGIVIAGMFAGTMDMDHGPGSALISNIGLTDGFIAKYRPTCSPPSLSLSGQTNLTCFGDSSGSASTSVTGGSAFTYAWAPYGGNGPAASNLGAGNYSVIVTNQCGDKDTVDVTLTQPASIDSSLTQTGCDSLSINGQIYTSSGTFTQTLTAASGCDSTLTLNLTVNQPTSGSLTQAGCDSLSINGQTYTSSGTYAQTLTAANGCDSTLTLNLTVNHPTSGSLTQTGCDSLSINGQTYTSSGTYTQTLSAANGCDSTLTLNLSVTNVPAAISASGATLTATPGNLSYQWLDCGNGNMPIPGATAQTFTPTVSGSYAVIVTDTPCADTSACEVVTDLAPCAFCAQVQIYPNPFADQINIEFPYVEAGYSIQVYDARGKDLISLPVEGLRQIIDTRDLAAGIYFLRLYGPEGGQVYQIVKE